MGRFIIDFICRSWIYVSRNLAFNMSKYNYTSLENRVIINLVQFPSLGHY